MSDILIIFIRSPYRQERRRLSRINICKRVQIFIFSTNCVISPSFTLCRPFGQKDWERHSLFFIHMIMSQELAISIWIMCYGLEMLNSLNLCSKLNYTYFSIDVMAIAGDPNLSELEVENVHKGSGVKLAVFHEVPDLFLEICPVHSQGNHYMSCMFVKNGNFSQKVFLMPILNNVKRMNLASIKPFKVSACRDCQLMGPF